MKLVLRGSDMQTAALQVQGQRRASQSAPAGGPVNELMALQALASKSRFHRNATIFNEGDAASQAYKVVSGTVRLCKHTPNGRRQIAGFRLPGEFFGFMEPGEYSVSAEAVTDVVLSCFPQRQLEALSENRPAIRNHFTNLMLRRLVEVQDHLVVLGRRSAMARVASFLVALSGRTGSEDDDVVDVPMSRQDIADFLGLTIETVCRALSDLKHDGYIQALSVQQFELTRRDALADLAAGADDE
jgi:CRP-like cAMP-binding protein